MSGALVPSPGREAQLETVVLHNDLSKLAPEERVSYYMALCEHLGLDWVTRPFQYLTLNGQLKLYADKNCAEQLRDKRGITLKIISKEVVDGVYVVCVGAVTPTGRSDEDIGARSIAGLKGKELVNAMLSAVTVAKRRATLSICSLGGIVDETEVDHIGGGGAQRVPAEWAERKAAPKEEPAKQIAAGANREASWAALQELKAELISVVGDKAEAGRVWAGRINADKAALWAAGAQAIDAAALTARGVIAELRAKAEQDDGPPDDEAELVPEPRKAEPAPTPVPTEPRPVPARDAEPAPSPTPKAAPSAADVWAALKAAGWPKGKQRGQLEYLIGSSKAETFTAEQITLALQRIAEVGPYDAAAVALIDAGKEVGK